MQNAELGAELNAERKVHNAECRVQGKECRVQNAELSANLGEGAAEREFIGSALMFCKSKQAC